MYAHRNIMASIDDSYCSENRKTIDNNLYCSENTQVDTTQVHFEVLKIFNHLEKFVVDGHVRINYLKVVTKQDLQFFQMLYYLGITRVLRKGNRRKLFSLDNIRIGNLISFGRKIQIFLYVSLFKCINIEQFINSNIQKVIKLTFSTHHYQECKFFL